MGEISPLTEDPRAESIQLAMASDGEKSTITLWTLADDADRRALDALYQRARASPGVLGPTVSGPPPQEHTGGFLTESLVAYGGPGLRPSHRGWLLAGALVAVGLVLLCGFYVFFFTYSADPTRPSDAWGVFAALGGFGGLAAISILALAIASVLDWLLDRAKRRGHQVNVETEEPLDELEKMARSHAARLHSSHRIQTIFACAVFLVLMALVAWGGILVTLQRTAMGAFFGSGGVGGGALLAKWQPFDRINTARDQANAAEALAFGYRERLKTIREIPDPKERQAIQWQATKEFMEEARNPVLPPDEQTKKKKNRKKPTSS